MKLYFIEIGEGRFINLAFVSEFKIEHGNLGGTVAKVTVGSMTHQFHGQPAEAAYAVFVKARKDAEK